MRKNVKKAKKNNQKSTFGSKSVKKGSPAKKSSTVKYTNNTITKKVQPKRNSSPKTSRGYSKIIIIR